MENGCEWMSFDELLMCLPTLGVSLRSGMIGVGGAGLYDAAGVNQFPLSGPAADTDLLDRTRDPECVLRDFRPDPLARKGKGD